LPACRRGIDCRRIIGTGAAKFRQAVLGCLDGGNQPGRLAERESEAPGLVSGSVAQGDGGPKAAADKDRPGNAELVENGVKNFSATLDSYCPGGWALCGFRPAVTGPVEEDETAADRCAILKRAELPAATANIVQAHDRLACAAETLFDCDAVLVDEAMGCWSAHPQNGEGRRRSPEGGSLVLLLGSHF
jgi:hypothetical protein